MLYSKINASNIISIAPTQVPKSFQSYADQYTWLKLNKDQKAICTICTEAHSTNQLPSSLTAQQLHSVQAWIIEGFNCWKNISRISNHLQSSIHIIAIEALNNKVSIIEKISDAEKRRLQRNRVALATIFSTLNFLAQQGLAIRGAGGGQESNYIQLLQIRSNDIPELKEYLTASGRKWLSADIQNEILAIFSRSLLESILDEIRASDYFSILLDETPDSSKLEQISICVRVVSKKFKISEYFLGFYNTEHGTCADTLLKIVLDVFTRFELDMKKLRGQCYDGASNMSGHKKGLQAKIRDIEPRALFVHCNAHNLNLVVQDAISELQWTRQYIGITREIINYVRESPKRLAQFRGLEESISNNLKAYCPTRLVFLTTFLLNYILI